MYNLVCSPFMPTHLFPDTSHTRVCVCVLHSPGARAVHRRNMIRNSITRPYISPRVLLTVDSWQNTSKSICVLRLISADYPSVRTLVGRSGQLGD
jgi:hypothetical protein